MPDEDLIGVAHDEGEEDLDYEDQDEEDNYTDGNDLIDSIQHTNGVNGSNDHIPMEEDDQNKLKKHLNANLDVNDNMGDGNIVI